MSETPSNFFWGTDYPRRKPKHVCPCCGSPAGYKVLSNTGRTWFVGYLHHRWPIEKNEIAQGRRQMSHTLFICLHCFEAIC